MESRVHKSLIKLIVSWEFWICDSTEPKSLIKPVVYEEFWTCKSKGPGLLIKPVVCEEVWARDCKSSGILIKPVVYEDFWTLVFRMGFLSETHSGSVFNHFPQNNFFFKLAGFEKWKSEKLFLNEKLFWFPKQFLGPKQFLFQVGQDWKMKKPEIVWKSQNNFWPKQFLFQVGGELINKRFGPQKLYYGTDCISWFPVFTKSSNPTHYAASRCKSRIFSFSVSTKTSKNIDCGKHSEKSRASTVLKSSNPTHYAASRWKNRIF